MFVIKPQQWTNEYVLLCMYSGVTCIWENKAVLWARFWDSCHWTASHKIALFTVTIMRKLGAYLAQFSSDSSGSHVVTSFSYRGMTKLRNQKILRPIFLWRLNQERCLSYTWHVCKSLSGNCQKIRVGDADETRLKFRCNRRSGIYKKSVITPYKHCSKHDYNLCHVFLVTPEHCWVSLYAIFISLLLLPALKLCFF
jgi:hypothetical protein